jgi:hypothetical protein
MTSARLWANPSLVASWHKLRYNLSRKAVLKPNRRYLEEYEENIILRDVLAKSRVFSAAGLVEMYPGRYNTRHLGATLRRMRSKGILSSTTKLGGSRKRPFYEVREAYR